MHTVQASNDQKRLSGTRDRDGDPCHAVWKKGGFKKRKSVVQKPRDQITPDDWITDLEDEDYDPYLILGCEPDDDDGVLKKAFRKPVSEPSYVVNNDACRFMVSKSSLEGRITMTPLLK